MMATSLIEIARDLAAEYPLVPTQQIADIIIDAIESGSVISHAISYVMIPTQIQLKQAEFKTKRLPTKRISQDKVNKRSVLLAHIENAHLLKQLKSLYTVPLEDTGLGPIIGLDGARVATIPFVPRPDTAYQPSPQQRHLNVYGTNATTPIPTNGSTVAYSDSSVFELSARNTRETTFSSLDFIADVGRNADQLLSLYDVFRVISLLQLFPNDNQLLLKIDDVIRNDVKIRNRGSKSDCLSELYRGDEQLPETLRLPRPKATDLRSMVPQRIRAITLDEYQRLQSEAAQKFTNGEISYDAYIQAESKYATFVDVLMAALS